METTDKDMEAQRLGSEDGCIVVGPFADLHQAEATLDRALQLSKNRRVRVADRGFSSVARLYHWADGWWLEGGRPVLGESVTDMFPVGTKGIASVSLFGPEDWQPLIGAAVYRIVKEEEDFRVVERLANYTPDLVVDESDLKTEAVMQAVSGEMGETRHIPYETDGAFSCRVVEHTLACLSSEDPATLRIEKSPHGVRVHTASGFELPAWRELSDSEWREIESALKTGAEGT